MTHHLSVSNFVAKEMGRERPIQRKRPAEDRALPGGGGQPTEPHRTERPGVLDVIAALEASGYRVNQTGHGRWTAQCPCHDEDGDTPLRIDVLPHMNMPGRLVPKIRCWLCGANGDDLCDALGLPHRLLMNDHSRFHNRPPRSKAKLPSPDDVDEWCRALWANDERLRYLRERRCLSERVIRVHRIGWDDERYTLPVYGDGEVVNLRRYLPSGDPKMLGLTLRGSQIYPSLPSGSWVILCEGEWDALACRSRRLPAVTSTAGVQGWSAEWDHHLAGLDVVVIYDCQAISRKVARQHGQRLHQVARSVRISDLAPRRRDGYDLTDWFRKGHTRTELLKLIRSQPPLGTKQ